MTTNPLADSVLPLIRTRTDLHRWSAATSHGRQMHQGVDLLEHAAESGQDPVTVYAVTHRALTSALTVIARADDSSGIIGDACRRLLRLHPTAAAAARTPAGKLLDWMINFQFHGTVDFFTLDPVAYAPALGPAGIATYRERLDQIRNRLPAEPAGPWTGHRHERWVLDWNARRLAVLDRDIDAIIRTHLRDRKIAAWYQDTAEALAEIGETDLAIDWAYQATSIDPVHQAMKAADYWCALLADHRPDQLLPARIEAFRRWPNSTKAARLHREAGDNWPDHHDEVLAALARSPHDLVTFALHTLKDPQLAWTMAHQHHLEGNQTWSDLATAYGKIDPVATLPVHGRLVEADLTQADAQHYKAAARRLATMRTLAAGTDQAADVDTLIAELRDTHRRRPRLQQEFNRAGLP